MKRKSLFVGLALCSLVSPFLHSQSKITFHPAFDSSVSERRYGSLSFKTQKRPRVGLVLSGGGARGASQIGVLKALEQRKIPVDFIAATSMGAIVGGLYASGYTTAEIESLALNTNWDELLSLSDEAKRIDLAFDQKLAADWSFVVVRFEGLKPVLPHAVSSGQRLTNFLSEKTLQAPYHPNPSFDDLKIPFRAVTTDLVSGKRVIVDSGSLAEALRATSTVPLLFNPVEKDSMQLIDGGLVTNIPVDVAKDAGCDIVIAVNSTSGFRNKSELQAPWQTADQIMGIMMQTSNEQQLKKANIVISPEIGQHLSSDFTGLDSLIEYGYRSAIEKADSILVLYWRVQQEMLARDEFTFQHARFELIQESSSGASQRRLLKEGTITSADIQRLVAEECDSAEIQDVAIDIYPHETPVRIESKLRVQSAVRVVEFSGNALVETDSLRNVFARMINRPLNRRLLKEAIERVLRMYRQRGYSLAQITQSQFDESSGILRIAISEGVIEKIEIVGGVRTEDSFVLREFAMKEGEVFNISRAQKGMTNISSTNLFEYTYLEVAYNDQKPILTIRIAELPSQLIRFGIRADDERNLQGTVDIRDENFRGLGAELGLTIGGGGRNVFINLEFRSNRLLSPFFTFSLSTLFSSFDSYLYGDDPTETRQNRWRRERFGEYTDRRYGGKLTVGAQVEKLGNVTIEYSLQNSRIENIRGAAQLEERSTLSLLKFGTVIDSRNRVPFPTSGVNMTLSYEFASAKFGSDVGYTALRSMWEAYTSWGRSTLHPKLTLGFGDITMPLGQQFRLGGREWMFGTREDDRRGRQLFAVNIEYRYRLPIQFVFDAYLRVRYDLASISAIPEQIKFSSFRHGVGTELALDTPVGQAALGLGNSFYIDQGLRENSLKRGPLLLYFTLGYELP